MPKKAYIITGGTFVDVAPHFALSAPAFGTVGRQLHTFMIEFNQQLPKFDEIILLRTAMASGGQVSPEEQNIYGDDLPRGIVTNTDLENVVTRLVDDPDTKAIVFTAAVCDWKPLVVSQQSQLPSTQFGKQVPRLHADGPLTLQLTPTEKVLRYVRQSRKDIFLVAVKATTDLSPDEQYIRGLRLLKNNSCNLVLCNDLSTRFGMVITPEEARYQETTDREAVLRELSEMIILRSQLTFTRSVVVPSDAIPWEDPRIPENLRAVVNHCITEGAYKPFQRATVGHFATRGDEPNVIFTSRRKSNFNHLARTGLLKIEATGTDSVRAYGGKPSVGGQSQRIIFEQHPDVDCIVHFHCPLKPGFQEMISIRQQRPYECGSHECGQNTSEGLTPVHEFHGIKVVMLENHGPNICFSRDTNPAHVVHLIDSCFDLSAKTGGQVSLAASA